MAIEGSLEIFQLPEILQMISGQRKTGILTVQGEADIVAVSFKDGQVVAADALNQTVEEGLGQILASQGLVAPRDFSSVAAEHEKGGKRLLDLLLERGLVDRGQLLEALRQQTYRLLLQLLRWDQGDFKFYAGDEVAYEEGFYAISVEELLIRSLSDLGDDGQGAGPPDLDLAYERVPGGPAIRFVGIDGPTPDAHGVWVNAEDRALVDRLDGRTPAGVLAIETGIGEYRALFALYRLLRAGAVRPVARAAASKAGPAALQPPARPAAPPPRVAPPAAAAAHPAAPVASGPARTATPFASYGGRSAASAEALPDTEGDLAPLPASAPAAPPAPKAATKGKVVVMPGVAKPAGPPLVALVVPPLVAAVVAVMLFAAPWIGPRDLLLPFPWLESARMSLERNQRSALYLQIDRAARTFFLLEGHYPDGLQDLLGRDLLAGGEMADPAGRPLAYTAENVSYEVQPIVRGEPQSALGVREAITGDFLLDPDFLDLPDKPERPPLVLLD